MSQNLDDVHVASRETRLQRGRRRGRLLSARALHELRERRRVLGLGQPTVARELGISQAQVWRLEAQLVDVTVVRLAEMASVLGLELSVGLHELGDPIRDRGQQALAKRFERILAPAWRVTSEMLLPTPGDLRSWDKLLRLSVAGNHQRVGVELETRIRDIQALVRRTRLRERDGGVDEILIVASDSATNRRLVNELRATLGPSYATNPRLVLRGLREGSALVGSGVILI